MAETAPIEFKSDAFEQLVLPGDTKEIIRPLGPGAGTRDRRDEKLKSQAAAQAALVSYVSFRHRCFAPMFACLKICRPGVDSAL